MGFLARLFTRKKKKSQQDSGYPPSSTSQATQGTVVNDGMTTIPLDGQVPRAVASSAAPPPPPHSNHQSQPSLPLPPAPLPPRPKPLGFAFDEKYQLGKKLGSGTFGVVKEVTSRATGVKYAVKIVDKAILRGRESMIISEIDVLRRVQHPHIIGLVELFESPTHISLVCDLATGGELFDQLSEKGHYDEKDAANLIKQILEALEYLHDRHIVHRDIKPENLLFKDRSPDAPIMVTDFGLSKVVSHDSSLQTACGTPAFIAPEIIRDGGYGKPVDMWAMGVLTYVLLSGYLPFYGDNSSQMFSSILKGTFDFPKEDWSQISDSAKEFISSLLKRDPNHRLTAHEALQHPWMSTQGTASIIQAVQKYSTARRKIRKAVDMVIGINRMKALSGERSDESSPTSLVTEESGDDFKNLGFAIVSEEKVDNYPINEQQIQRKRELERQLDKDIQELNLYKDSLSKTDELTQKMMTMLASFDDTLDDLEATILPIHKSTQKLTRIQENIDKAIDQVMTVIGYLDMGSKEQGTVMLKSSPEDDLQVFLESLKSVRSGLLHLQQNRISSTQKSVVDLKNALEVGVNQLDVLFAKWCASISQPLDAATLEAGELPIPPDDLLQNMNTVGNELTTTASMFGDISIAKRRGSALSRHVSDQGVGAVANFDVSHLNSYISIRTLFLLKTLQPLHSAVLAFLGHFESITADMEKESGLDAVGSQVGNILSVVSGQGKNTSQNAGSNVFSYVKRTSPLLPYTRGLLRLLKAEKEITQKVMSKKVAIQVYQAIMPHVLTPFIEVTTTLVALAKRLINGRAFATIASTSDGGYLILESLEFVAPFLKEYDGVLTYAGPKGNCLLDFYSNCRTTALSFLKEINEELNRENNKQSQLSVDGTVHELTSMTLNALKKFMDFSRTIDQMLADGLGVSLNIAFMSFGEWVSDVLNALLQNIDKKSQLYLKSNKNVLSTIFLLNNYHYVYKSLKSAPALMELLGKDTEEKYSKLYTKQRDNYISGWRPLCGYLMDSTLIQNGVIQKTLNKSQKEDVKEKFKNFNNAIDERFLMEKTYTIPDSELRLLVIKEIKKVILPLYGRFYDKYQEIEFSKNPQKYMKYDKKGLDELLDKFFDVSA